jgi:hypothetical protein
MAGIDRRAEIDTETVRALLLANGGGAVALLAFLSTVFGTEGLRPLAPYVIAALALFMLGLVAAIVHNHLRRRCSLAYEQGRPKARILGRECPEPGVCLWSWAMMYLSVGSFFLAGMVVCIGGWRIP